MINSEFFPIVIFTIFIIGLLILDLFIFHRKKHTITIKESLAWTSFWVSLALLFNLGIYFTKGTEPALQFLAGYLLEESLSIDNLFVFLLIFSYFRVPSKYMHDILFWGILGALIMRAIFIIGGIALISRFHWLIYVFGAFLIVAGAKLAFQKESQFDPENSFVIKLFKRFFPVTHTYEDGRFFIKKDGRWTATTLFLVLLSIETTDVFFALDSIPAIFAITLDPFIIYTSNIFAILGLRSLYFTLAGMMDLFHHLHYGLAFILVFIGVKMLSQAYIHIPITITLLVIISTIILSIISSLVFKQNKN